MLVTDAVRSTGNAIRTDPQGPEKMIFHMIGQWLFVCESDLLDIAFKIQKFPLGDDWKQYDLSDGLMIAMLEQVGRDIEAVGRLPDLIIEGPCLLQSPSGQTVVRWDGQVLRGNMPLNHTLLMDANWKRMSAHAPIQVRRTIVDGITDPGDASGDPGDAPVAIEDHRISVGDLGGEQASVSGEGTGQGEGVRSTGTGQETGGSSGVQYSTVLGDADGGTTLDGGSCSHAGRGACRGEITEGRDTLGRTAGDYES